MAKNSKAFEQYFLPYQVRWLNDRSRIKIWEKSRRIGATYVQSYEDVEDVFMGRVEKVWFTSADESAAREYIDYCEKWVRLFDKTGRRVGISVLENERDIKTYTIEIRGRQINALSSNPKAMRSKGGKVVWDEAAWHDDPRKMWAALRPVITWGYPLRILSTHNGKNALFYKFIEDIKEGRLNWAHHWTDIHLAVEEGLVDKILGRPTTQEERDAWIEEERKNCRDASTWAQEYCCEPMDETTAFMPYDLIEKVEKDDLLMRLSETQGDLYVGFDIARKRHLSVIWVVEKVGPVKFTRKIKTMENTPFHIQRDVLFEVLANPRVRRACIDATGLGMQLAEEAQLAFGTYKVEAVTFTNKVKEELAFGLYRQVEDTAFLIPRDPVVREDWHSVTKVTTPSGNIRLDADETAEGHADRFWAAALANEAAKQYSGPTEVHSRGRRQSSRILGGY